MNAPRLSQIVPRSILRNRWVIVLVCYLDDSGKDPQNQATTIAGYVATETAWEQFEAAVEPWFSAFGVNILHAKDLHHTAGEFRDWTVLKKQSFVSRICQARNPYITLGVSMGVVKQVYHSTRMSNGKRPRASAYGYCFQGILNWLLTDIRTGMLANRDGISFILESGHENNPDAERIFHEIRSDDRYDLEGKLKSISFVPKDACRAIQLADLFAFYSRRGNESLLKAKAEGAEMHAIDTMERILVEGMPHRGIVANSFTEKSTDPLPPVVL